MKINELTKCLGGKLKLTPSEARHTNYRMECSGGIVALPTLLRVSRGSGELNNNNIGHVAKALGLSEYDLRQTVGCHIGRPCVLLCLSSMLLNFVKQRHQQEGDLFRPGLIAMADSVRLLLAEPEFRSTNAWNRSEMKALTRVEESLQELCADRDIGNVAKRVLMLVRGA